MAIPLRPALAAVVSVLGAGTMMFPSVAGAHDPDEIRPRLARACQRIPRVEHRLDEVLNRIDGDETVRGSLAWLEAKLAEAEQNGREHRVTVIENRLAVRTKARELVELRQHEAATWRELCEDHGVDL